LQLKIVICGILLFSSSVVGYLFSLRYSLRVKQISYLQNSLKGLETEILYYSTPLPMAMQKTACRCNKSISGIFDETFRLLNSRNGYSIEEAWKSAVLKQINNTSLTKEDAEIIIGFGKDLGVGDKEVQKSHFRFINILLDEQKNKAVYEQNKNGKMCNRLGILLGLAIVIILI